MASNFSLWLRSMLSNLFVVAIALSSILRRISSNLNSKFSLELKLDRSKAAEITPTLNENESFNSFLSLSDIEVPFDFFDFETIRIAMLSAAIATHKHIIILVSIFSPYTLSITYEHAKTNAVDYYFRFLVRENA